MQPFGVRQPQLPLLYVRSLPVAYESGSCGCRTPNWLDGSEGMLNLLMKDRWLAAIGVIALLGGLGYTIVTPPDRVPDEFSHFFRAVAMAEGDFFPPVGLQAPGHHFPLGIWELRRHLGK